MTVYNSDPVNADALMARIREEVAKRKHDAAAGGIAPAASGPIHAFAQISLNPLPLPQLPKPQFALAERFHLNDFLALHDEDFISAAYRGVLKRNGDVQGREHFLISLRSGALSKIEILGRLRYSPEGRSLGVPVQGLLPAFAMQHVYRFPVIGGLIAFMTALFRLPRIARILQGLEGYQHQRNTELEAAIKNLAVVADGNERQLAAGIARNEDGASEFARRSEAALAELNRHTQYVLANGQGLAKRVSESIDSVTQRQAETRSRVENAERRIAASESRHDAFDGRVALVESHRQDVDRQLVDVIALSQQTSAQLASTLRETLGTLEQRVDSLGKMLQSDQEQSQRVRQRIVERVARVEGRVHEHGLRLVESPSNFNSTTGNATSDPLPAASRFDKIYFAFEQRFRGSREEIRKRLAYYLPLLHESVVGKEEAAVLDIGCGRGEWLELLRDENVTARGVDLSEEMVKECIDLGLDVRLGNAIEYLKQLPDNALGALTGFHIIEHVPLDTLIELIEQAHRVVQPGGLVIFETPNPENVVVGACNFYIDPTHQRPLPPLLTQFLVEAGGFADVTIHRVNANLLLQVFDEPGEGDPPALRKALRYLRGAFLCAPDYSVVGHVA